MTSHELYEAMKWKVDNTSAPENKWAFDKMESLCEWYENTGTLSDKQIEFGQKLLNNW